MKEIEKNQYTCQIVKEKNRYVVYLNTDSRKRERGTRERNLNRLKERLGELKGMIKKGPIDSRDTLLLKLGEAFKQFSPVKKYIKLILAKELKGAYSVRRETRKDIEGSKNS